MDNFRIVSPAPSDYSPNYSLVFQFESKHSPAQLMQWMNDRLHLPIYITAIYLIFIFVGQMYMSKRETPFRLKKVMIVWNIVLGFFSVCGALRMIPEMVHVLRNFGFKDSVCMNSYFTEVPVTCFWMFLFTLSKIPELVDTVFVVLRKQKLIFLHWYHHATVNLFTWYAYASSSAPGRWYGTMNFTVHGVMYNYYALRALGIRVPRPIAMFITVSQIAQMIMGTFVTFYAYYQKVDGNSCDISYFTLYAGIIMYVSYLILFVDFFVATYLTKPQVESKKIQ